MIGGCWLDMLPTIGGVKVVRMKSTLDSVSVIHVQIVGFMKLRHYQFVGSQTNIVHVYAQ